MRLLKALVIPKYFGIFVLSFISFVAIYVYFQVIGILENFLFWFMVTPPLNLAIFLAFALLLGAAISYQAYLRSLPKTCPLKESAAATSSLGIVGLFISACPACASLGIFILPASALAFIANYGIFLNLIGIISLIYLLNYLGGLKK
ncbi:MAG: hypothetical protein HY364_00030 [Candidatus Aenigmarchaeota archaeon]|nr:hypothetical protein [Candidatus Aenigmarchaeota archaeon]